MANRLIAHLAHVEVLTPKIAETTWFFEELLKMYVVKRDERSVYLRAWGEFYVPFSLKLTESDQGGLGHVAWRADSEDDLNTVAKMAQSNGSGIGWTRGEWSHGKSYRFRTPDGHINEIFWEMEKYRAPPELRSKIKARPMKMPNGTAAVRRLDHCTIFASDVKAVREWYQHFGMKLNEGFYSSKQNKELGAFLTANIRDHELGIIDDITGAKGRLNHVAFHLENIGMWIEGCDVFVENGISVEMGPLRHGRTDSFGLYVIEPGGNRVEMFHGGYLNFVPVQDWEPILSDVDAEEGKYGIPWGLGLLWETWQSYGTPIVPIPPGAKSVLERLREHGKQDAYHPKNPKAIQAK